ncbi:unnamed protein product [Caenorhabditis auriculariae]|uniref:RING-CH-type domain-containing protein n=1 Tax=Caenorhabditis auriculariae TaxID=2777116 RepID=A0A8S1HMR7_9PELO|nr:unnamed protein product [Caenorhabditis auriculariae]
MEEEYRLEHTKIPDPLTGTSSNSVDSGLSNTTLNTSLRSESVENDPLIVDEAISLDDDVVQKSDDVTENNFKLWKGTEYLKSTQLFSSKVSLLSNGAPLCRICHTTSSTRQNPLISPCRCSGTLLYVHKGCIVRWLEMSTRKMVPSPRCELCGYDYRRGNIFSMSSIHLPHVNRSSCILNVLFMIALVIMVICGTLTVRFLQANAAAKQRSIFEPAITLAPTYTWRRRGYFGGALNGDPPQLEMLEHHYATYPPLSELFDANVVICGTMFMTAFLIALFTQYRAEASIFRCIFRFFVINKNWMIRNYDIRDDPEMQARREARIAEEGSRREEEAHSNPEKSVC